jgi:adenosylcobyric acid synthase
MSGSLPPTSAITKSFVKALSILGTSSNAGKSWVATAFCALLRRQGLRVAPFKAQNMSNNSYVTLEGGEIGRAQAVQAEACGLRPIAEMNPVLLKPSGDARSQVVLRGVPGPHVRAGDYYRDLAPLWAEIVSVLAWWKGRCDVLVLEGAGSPVELNLMERDLVNLRPVEHLDGRWLLVADIERGGVFAQAIGTVHLMPPAARARGLGLIVNKFRGDLSLFDGAGTWFAEHIGTPYLGVLPMRYALQPETEDGFSIENTACASAAEVAWVRFPRVSNSQDAHPWRTDTGVQVRWVSKPAELAAARIIVLPGSKDTLADLRWLRETGLARVICERARAGVPVVGICGGYQMLGHRLVDPYGLAGTAGAVEGLGLLPLDTSFTAHKRVLQVQAHFGDDCWMAYEIHMGESHTTAEAPPLVSITEGGRTTPEGLRMGNIWGTYLHGLFETAATREALASAAGIDAYRVGVRDWTAHKDALYTQMADLLEEHLDLDGLLRYVGA